MPHTQVQDIRTISSRPDEYHGWPTVARLSNGDLVVACSGGRNHHVGPSGRTQLIRSRDRGESWSDAEIINNSAVDDRDAGVLETRAGTLLVAWVATVGWETYNARYEPWSEAYRNLDELGRKRMDAFHACSRELSQEARRRDRGCWALRSEDGGKTWESRVDTIVHSPHGPIELNDGRLLYLGKRWGDSHLVGAVESTDDGRTWQWITHLPAMEPHTLASYGEPHAVETEDGRIVAHIRNNQMPWKGETLQTESFDGGHSWTPTHRINVWGLPSHLLRLGDGRLLMTYGHRREPFGNQARISEDHGETWSDPLTISDDGGGWDLGYPSTVEMDDGSLLTIWYESMADDTRPFPKAVLRQARWSLKD